tara:strand:- start:115412 stop:115864 length:453 start_codon:yes stop_codon:yes gene_type:complete
MVASIGDLINQQTDSISPLTVRSYGQQESTREASPWHHPLHFKSTAHLWITWLGSSHKTALKHDLPAPTRTELLRNAKSPGKSEALLNGAERFRSVPVVKVGDAGPEHIDDFPEKTAILGKGISELTREELISLASSLAEQLAKLASKPS